MLSKSLCWGLPTILGSYHLLCQGSPLGLGACVGGFLVFPSMHGGAQTMLWYAVPAPASW